MSSSRSPSLAEISDGVPDKGKPETFPRMGTLEKRKSLLWCLQLLWANRRLLLKAAVCAFLASVLVALLIPVKFQSSTRLMPPDNSSNSGLGLLASLAGGGVGGGAGLGGLASVAGGLLGTKTSSDLFIGILNSENIQDAIIDQFQLKKVYRDSKIEDARISLHKRTEVSADRKSGIITINVTDHDPQRAAGIARAYVDELDRVVAQVSTSSARRERIFLEERLKSTKIELDAAAKHFGEFASTNTAIDINAQGKATVEAAATLQGEMIAAQSQLEGMRQAFTDDNVRVRSLKARIDELNNKLKEIGGIGGRVGVPGDNSLFPSIRRLPILGVTYADLSRQTRIDQAIYEQLTQQYEMARVQEAKDIPTVKVLDAAIVPTKKTFPPRKVVVILGTILGVAIAITWVLGKAQWDAVEASDPRKMFAVEVFSTAQTWVPQIVRKEAAGESKGRCSTFR